MSNIHEAITAIMSEGYAVTKTKRNEKQGFMYRGIDDVMNTFQPLLAKHHVFVVPEVLEIQRHERTTKSGTLLYSILKVKYTFYADDGSSVSAVVIGEGMDSGDKASNKALAIAMKYAMFQVFCIPTEEMRDPDADTPLPSRPEPKPEPEPKPKSEPAAICCDNCGEEIEPYTDANGGKVSVRRWAESSKEAFGRVLCPACVEREKAIAALKQYEEVTVEN